MFWQDLDRSRVSPKLLDEEPKRLQGLARLLSYELEGDIPLRDEMKTGDDEHDGSHYHTFTIPYGPGMSAKEIERLFYDRDMRG